MSKVLETVKRIATASGYQLLNDATNFDGPYTLQQPGSDCPVGIFQSLDEVIVYLMAQTPSNRFSQNSWE